ncbi:hypothetical protein [Crossiella sp. CA198]|uniref:hypothetical protein n=1 Tax=Crossiella sp. CA198 TaxID=3455607 RepID=UPI003F8CFB80
MNSTFIKRRLHALHQAAEQAAGVHREAFRAAGYEAKRTAGLAMLVRQHPTRVDYRSAWESARADFLTAQQRAHLAYEQWFNANLRADAAWTESQAGAA